MYDDQPPTPPRRLLLFVVASVLALALPFVLVSRLLGSQSQDPGASRPPTAVATTASPGRPASALAHTVARTSSSPTSAAANGSLAAEEESCRLANLREQAAMGTAAASLEQFQKHIDAMNLLVAGTISLSVATQFWDQTRVAAQEKAAAFRAADKALTAGGASCPELGPTAACSAPLDRVNAITACAKAERARLTVLSRARTAVTTWEHHIHDMEMLRLGHITPAQATSRWQKNWKTGQKQVDAYSVAAQLTAKLRCPLT